MDIPWTEVKVDRAGIFPETGNPHPAVWLNQAEGESSLPIQIGQNEALAISSELQGEPTQRPSTNDLFNNLLNQIGGEIDEVRITELKDTIFYAEILISAKGEQIRLDARPSDGIVLALKRGAKIRVAQQVFKEAGI